MASVKGNLLIATPKVNGKFFKHSVIYVHTDDDTGSVGVLLNMPMDYDMAERWSIEMDWQYPERIHCGGPIERQLGYVIHTNDYAHDTSIALNEYISYTSGRSIVYDINRGMGPSQFILTTGYCAWQPKQLQAEIDQGMWVVVEFDLDYFFQPLDREHGWKYSINVAAENITKDLLDQVDMV